jgi:hypothetical protein
VIVAVFGRTAIDAIITWYRPVFVGLLIVRVSTPEVAPAEEAATKVMAALSSPQESSSAPSVRRMYFPMLFTNFIPAVQLLIRESSPSAVCRDRTYERDYPRSPATNVNRYTISLDRDDSSEDLAGTHPFISADGSVATHRNDLGNASVSSQPGKTSLKPGISRPVPFKSRYAMCDHSAISLVKNNIRQFDVEWRQRLDGNYFTVPYGRMHALTGSPEPYRVS